MAVTQRELSTISTSNTCSSVSVIKRMITELIINSELLVAIAMLYIVETYIVNKATELKRKPPQKNLSLSRGGCLCLEESMIIFDPLMISLRR
mmetsp:Transcript_11813/g.15322  ORF Transcript_11813/g.15322 Transcript_11813/m.15322 type:complete len:93 (-) Transcript_11813:86-364(-)